MPFGTITTISESPKTFGVLYVGTDEGKVWGTRDGGATWKDLSKGLAKDRWVTRVVASAHDEGTVFVSQSGYRNDDFAPYVWRSTDFGATWTSIAAGLPNEPVNSVREDPKARHLLWAATDARGVRLARPGHDLERPHRGPPARPGPRPRRSTRRRGTSSSGPTAGAPSSPRPPRCAS